MQSIAVVVLLLADSLPLIFLFAVLLGIGFGGRNPLTTATKGRLLRTKSPRQHYRNLHGSDECPVVGVPALRRDYVRYTGALHLMAVVSLIGSTLFLPLGPPEVPSASEGISAPKSEVVS